MTSLVASVVLAVHNDTRARRAVAALQAQTMPRSDYEIIVVENGSAALADLGAEPGVRYLHVDRASSAAARNAGLASTRGRYLLLTDADCVPDPTGSGPCPALLPGPGRSSRAVGS